MCVSIYTEEAPASHSFYQVKCDHFQTQGISLVSSKKVHAAEPGLFASTSGRTPRTVTGTRFGRMFRCCFTPVLSAESWIQEIKTKQRFAIHPFQHFNGERYPALLHASSQGTEHNQTNYQLLFS